MADGGKVTSWRRRIVGKPRIWIGIVWCLIGLAWVADAVFLGPDFMRVVLGVFWLAVGTMYLVDGVHDYRRNAGAYAVHR